MDKQPKWVPEWVWTEYLEFVQVCGHMSADWVVELNRASERPAERVAREIVFDKDLASLWRAMERRDKSHEMVWEKDQQRTHEHVSSSGRPKTWGLFMHVLGTMHGPSPHDLVGHDDRQARGASIAKLARRLRRELARCQIRHSHLPEPIETHVYAAAAALAKNLVQSSVQTRITAGIASSVASARVEDAFLMGAMAAFCYGTSQDEPLGFPILEGLEAGGDAWAKSEPVVYRPRDKTAVRTYFVRSITAYFRHWYGAPLRKEAASLTRKFFDGDMDASFVLKLAP